MILNPDCLREVLLSLEEHQKPANPNATFIRPFQPNDLIPLLNYSTADVFYSVSQLTVSHLIDCDFDTMLSGYQHFFIRGITPTGHDFLNSVKPANKWAIVKNKLKTLEKITVIALVDIAKQAAVNQLI